MKIHHSKLLDGINYLPWSCIALLAIQRLGLSDDLMGEAKELKVGDASHSRRIFESFLVTSWFLYSQQPEISRSFHRT